jgi:hypothetical protein
MGMGEIKAVSRQGGMAVESGGLAVCRAGGRNQPVPLLTA